MNERELEVLVDRIAQRVRERLQTGDSSASHCSASEEQCEACGQCVSRRPWDAKSLIKVGAERIGASTLGSKPDLQLAPYIDHTLLKPDATRDQIKQICEEAKQYGFYSVCINPSYVRYAKSLLQGSNVKVVAVVGFPLGATEGSAKAFEAREAVRAGAEEIDMVINIGALKSRDYGVVLDDICKVVQAVQPKVVKVIIETSMINDEEKVIACTLSKIGGAHFVKTSTGFGGGGATADDVSLMKRVVGEELQVKASGGIRTTEDAKKMIEAGATRIGASASVAVVTGAKDKKARPGAY